MPAQSELGLPLPALGPDEPPIPVRMLNEHVYCPRLAYLEWVQGEWADSADTVEGRWRHRRVDQTTGDLPPRKADSATAESVDDEEPQRIHARSITLASMQLGLIAKLDLVEGEGDTGDTCDEGAIYYVESRERVRVPFDAELRALTLRSIAELRASAASGRIPPPLHDSPKCPRCSLVTLCLPDELHSLRDPDQPPRPLAVARHEALPLYVQQFNAKLAKKGEVLEVSKDDTLLASARIAEVSQVVLMGNVYVTAPCLAELMQRGIPVTWHSYGGWFHGHTLGNGHKNVELRTAQYRASFDERHCLRIARGLVMAKIVNSRTLLRRNWKPEEKPERALADLKRLIDHARRAENLESLLGVEGQAAAIYFAHFRDLLRPSKDSDRIAFDFSTRNRRPPTDAVNALLSLAYALLVRTLTVTLQAVGFDPFRGYYHQPRYGRPALALDLMEPFRPLLADSAVIQAINNGEVQASDFVSVAGAVNLHPDGRKRFIAAFERRLDHEIVHPLFGYRISYRRLLELQSRLFGRHLLGELPDYPNFTTR